MVVLEKTDSSQLAFFWSNSQSSNYQYRHPISKRKMEILASSQAEMNAIIAEQKIRAALTRNITPAADRVHKFGEEVLVYSEKEKKLIGAETIVDITRKMKTIQ